MLEPPERARRLGERPVAGPDRLGCLLIGRRQILEQAADIVKRQA
jgi:hypothetical protein